MKTFSAFQSQWNQACLNDSELLLSLEKKLPSLLSHPDEDVVRQGIDLLTDVGGLVFILEERNGAIAVSDSYGGTLRVVEKYVIEEVDQPQSEWFGLVERGCFDEIYFRTLNETEWSILSEP